MATRFYLEYDSAPAVTPAAWDSGWDYQSGDGTFTYKATTTPEDTTLSVITHRNNSVSSAQLGSLVRFVSAPLAAQTLSGSIKGQIQASEQANNNNATVAIAISVINSSGTIVGTLLSAVASDNINSRPNECVSGTLTNDKFADLSENNSISLSSYDCADDDRIVIELGFREVRSLSTEDLYIGTNAVNGDLAEDWTETADGYRGWVEFTATLSFATAGSPINALLAGLGGVVAAITAKGQAIASLAGLGDLQIVGGLKADVAATAAGAGTLAGAISSRDGSTPTIVTHVVDPGSGTGYDYTSLSAWEAGQRRDLTSGNEIAVAKCRSSETGGVHPADTTACVFSASWVTSSTDYIQIWTDPEDTGGTSPGGKDFGSGATHRHDGKWNENAYRLDVTGTLGISVGATATANDVRIIGIQARITRSTGSVSLIELRGTAGGVRHVTECVLCAVLTSTASAFLVNSNRTESTVRLINNIGYDADLAVSYGIYLAYGTGYLYNNTIVNCVSGYRPGSGQTNTIKNCMAQDCSTDGFLGTWTTADCNCSDIDGDAPGTNPRTGEVTFVDEVNHDFHLDSTDTIAIGYGVDLSGEFTTDIDGQTRSSWDIGADECVATGGTDEIVAVLAGAGALSASISYRNAIDVVAAGVGALSGDLQGRGQMDAASAGIGALAGAISSRTEGEQQPINAVLVGLGALSGTITARGQMVAAAAGLGALAGLLNGRGQIVGLSGGLGSLAGLAGGRGQLLATLPGVGNLTALATARGQMAAAAAGIGSLSGILGSKQEGAVYGTLAGVGSLSALASGRGQMAATCAGVGSLSGALAGKRQIVAVIAATSSLSGILAGRLSTSAVFAGAGALAGTIAGRVQIKATSAGIGILLGVLSSRLDQIQINAILSGVGGLSGLLQGRAQLVALLVGTGRLTAILRSPITEETWYDKDLDLFFDEVFATDVIVNGATIKGIYQDPYMNEFGIDGMTPSLICQSREIPVNTGVGDAVSVGGASFHIAQMHDDQTGLTLIRMEWQSGSAPLPTEDRDPFFEDFGTSGKVGLITMDAIFDRASVEDLAIVGHTHQATVKTDVLPQSAKIGSTFTHEGTQYTIKGMQRDGVGMTVLQLREKS